MSRIVAGEAAEIDFTQHLVGTDHQALVAEASSETASRRALRSALAEAVLQDFIDDMPALVRPNDIATRLRLTPQRVYAEIRKDRLVAEPLRPGKRLLMIDVNTPVNRRWIAQSLSSRYRRASQVARPSSSVSVTISSAGPLAQLSALTSSGLSASDAVELALTSMTHWFTEPPHQTRPDRGADSRANEVLALREG